MSGGSHGYIYSQIDSELCGQMHDPELNDLMEDIAELAHALEWYDSGDTCRETYDKTVADFKVKWFKGDRPNRLRHYIDDAIDDLRDELIRMIGVDDHQPLMEAMKDDGR